MRPIPLLLLLVLGGASLARPGPDTANTLKLAEPAFSLAVAPVPGACPTPFRLTLTRDMPDPGWTLKVDRVERKAGRVVVRVTGTRGDGLYPQVITPRSVTADLGRFKKGCHVLEIHFRASADAAYKLVQVALMRGA